MNGMVRDSVAEVTAVITAAGLGERPWSDVSQALVRMTGANTNSMWVGDAGAGRIEMLSTSFDARVERDYTAHYVQEDLWALRGSSKLGQVFRGEELASPEDWAPLSIWSDFYGRIGINRLLAVCVPVGGGAGYCALGLHRPEAGRPFTEDDAGKLRQVVAPMAAHLRLRHELRLATGAAVAAMAGLEMTGQAALAVTGQGRILHANTRARAAMAQGRGIRGRLGELAPANPRDAAALDALLARVAAGGAGGLLRLSPGPGGEELHLLAARAPDAPRGEVLLLFLLTPDRRRLEGRAGLLMALHGLTGAEAAVAARVAEGAAAADIAAERGTSEGTVRSQLRQVLGKTGAENLRVLAGLVAGLPES